MQRLATILLFSGGEMHLKTVLDRRQDVIFFPHTRLSR